MWHLYFCSYLIYIYAYCVTSYLFPINLSNFSSLVRLSQSWSWWIYLHLVVLILFNYFISLLPLLTWILSLRWIIISKIGINFSSSRWGRTKDTFLISNTTKHNPSYIPESKRYFSSSLKEKSHTLLCLIKHSDVTFDITVG